MRVQVRTVDGVNHVSDQSDDLETSDMQAFVGMLKNWPTLNYLSIVVKGRTKFFNPANVIYVELAK